jgi:hypothetical protein
VTIRIQVTNVSCINANSSKVTLTEVELKDARLMLGLAADVADAMRVRAHEVAVHQLHCAPVYRSFAKISNHLGISFVK